MPIPCPCCRASNDTGPACRRCKADLALLFALEANRAEHFAAARVATATRLTTNGGAASEPGALARVVALSDYLFTEEGFVGNQMDLNIARIRALQVPGVFSVTNNLRIG